MIKISLNLTKKPIKIHRPLGLLLLGVCVLFATQTQAQVTTFPYFTDFEADDGGWTTGGTLWELGTPAGAVITGAASGVNAFATDLDATYPVNAFETLVSPTFDFSGFTDDPTITLDIFWDSEFSWDGTVLESSIDAGATWQQVGALGDPDNWYTDGTISGLSNGGASGEGWSGSDGTTSGEYVEAIHALDGLAGQTAVQLRFVFGSDASFVDDGVAIDNIFVGTPPPPPIADFPYQESFEDGDGGWTTPDGTLWELGTPAKEVIIGAADGTNAWVTGITGDYPSNAFEAVVSPVFDFSGFAEDPTILMDIWWNSEFSWDGVVLESSIDAGTTWVQVGAFGDPDNWYTDNTVSGLSNGGATGEGWTGRDGDGTGATDGSLGYVEAAHALDGLAGETAVQLRVLFGSDGSVTDDGFAFDNVRINDGSAPDPLEVECQDITVSLDEDGLASIMPSDVLASASNGNGQLFALSAFSSAISLYDLEMGNTILEDASFLGDTTFGTNFGFDVNPVDGQVYLIADSGAGDRNLYTIDLQNGNVNPVLVGTITPASGGNVQVASFGPDGTLYLALSSANIDALDLGTMTATFFAAANNEGAVGLTTDFDNNRLIHATGTGPIDLTEIDLATGTSSPLFTLTDGINSCTAQAIEHIGNDTLIASSTSGCGDVYTINLLTEAITDIGDSADPVDGMTKDLLFIPEFDGDLSIDISEFDCDDIGENTVTLTLTDGDQTATCEAIVTVVDDLAPTIECPEDTVVNAETGDTTVELPDFTGDAVADDNCPDFTVTQDPAAGTVFDAGTTETVTITVTDASGNETSCSFEITLDFSLSTDEFNLNNSISVYPNPTRGLLTINNADNISLIQATITDLNGRIIQTLPLEDTINAQISLESLSNGIYFIRINSENASITRPIIKN